MKLFRAFGRSPSPKPVDPVAEDRLRAREAFAAGDAARDAGDWAGAAGHYAVAAALDPGNAALLIQQGHALKETGHLAEAELAYSAAAKADPHDADATFQSAYALTRLGRDEEAIEAYVEALRRRPELSAARDALIGLGARGRVPGELLGRSASVRGLAGLARTLDECLSALKDLAAVSIFPVEAYDAFRRTFPIQPCPPSSVAPRFPVVLIQATGMPPSALRDTLVSLQDQRETDWVAIVECGPETRDHPIASFGQTDPRVRFLGAEPHSLASSLIEVADRDVLMMTAGTLLDREAVSWLGYAKERTGVAALYTDHDHYVRHWRFGLARQGPVLQPMPDRDDLMSTPQPPALVLVDRRLTALLLDAVTHYIDGQAARRHILTTLMPGDRIAHLPRILASVPVPPIDHAMPAPTEGVELEKASTGDRILIIVPTRDQADLLEICVQSLKAKATRPDEIDILVLDNRSVEPETSILLTRLTEMGVQTMAMDEAFNWSRFNNLGAAGRDHRYLVFANNDVEILTQGWDSRLRNHLDRADIGLVGVRMVYPDRTIQHAGVVLGGTAGRPYHEGSGAATVDSGPLGRWRRSHLAAAVTGAFMACRRDVFERLGGFDEGLGIAYNDIDFSLRARAASLGVLYAADIELIHHESKTRGSADTREKGAWDDSELFDVHARWGDAFFFDPGLNPQWSFTEANPYDGYRDLTASQVLAQLDLSARHRPWSIDPSSDWLSLVARAR